MDLDRHWKRIVNAMVEGVFVVSTSGKILLVNDAMCSLTGYSREELLSTTCHIFECDVCEKERSLDGAWCKLFTVSRSMPKRCAIRRKDGSFLPVLKNQAHLFDEEGAIVGAVETLFDVSDLDERERQIEDLSRRLGHEGSFHGMVGQSEVMLRVFTLLDKASKSDAPILLLGESGTGKELAARAIHELGSRQAGPYVQLNCAALNEALLESELFGHMKGAFTGAHRHRIGRFEAAHKGDLFLDEIGDVPLSIQVKLLRVLETKYIERVGDNQPIAADVRIIAATNKNLAKLVEEGTYREDLYYRINVIPIALPRLQDRLEDLPLLVDHFVKQLQIKTGKPIHGIDSAAMRRFTQWTWPGNIRELRSVLEYAFVVCEGDRITVEDLPIQFGDTQDCSQPETRVFPSDLNEREALVGALEAAHGNKSEAARLLGVSRGTVLNRMRKYGVDLAKTITK
ncbi:sigma-54 interaction domain-containing protein [Desulfovibrio inopinatus]|uniref:sigma-54 interaction domain-containing protein n=1 Tax=Desulfovibrio inopinatus TaxID=102109 RepID=UPI00040B2846|nr:sigma 54-interacting transcriptional regulator [Desulfovibrio inopinatus]